MHFPTCSIDGCNRKRYCRGWCERHYARWRKHGNTDGLRPEGPPEERFWHYVEKGSPDECWRWKAHIDARGYGKFQMHGRTHPAARAAYILTRGPIPKGQVVRHKCDNGACVNPAHLELGTQRDNVRDMIERGRGNWRAPKGEERHNAILTEDNVREIRASNERGVDLAARFGVSPVTISAIRVGRLWKHLL